MRKIKDERLIVQNLKNIRVAFIIQTLGILSLLVYDGLQNGILHAYENPLWFIFILTAVVLGYLNLKILVDVYDNKRENLVPYYIIPLGSFLLGGVFTLIVTAGPDGNLQSGLLVGSVVGLVFFLTFTYGHYLVKKRNEE
ncbi:hypothetical protein A2U94_13785 [Bacillus sp. VT 712]|uniref:hypothetical protein n=1 Tax=Bacillaceae TaxID=186817 RepID=UPI0007A475CA|nr:MULTISPECIES: hypothetical protein [Bacillaceae]KZB90839.1 hypothetical protein A2U94_13785 [Bacillus sp. VT 712]